jgi:hypothetical protein
MSKSRTVIQGTPVECGAAVWEQLCGPAVLAASGRPSKELAQFYSGILSAAFGSMAADFGHEQATKIARTLVDAFAGMADELPGGRTQ